MKRVTIEGERYLTDNGEIIAYGSLYIINNHDEHPRLLPPVDMLRGTTKTTGEMFTSTSPEGVAEFELVETPKNLYYPTTEYSTFEEAKKNPHSSSPPTFAVKRGEYDGPGLNDEFRITVHDTVQSTTLSQLAEDGQRYRDKTHILVTIDGDRTQTTIPLDEFNEWLHQDQVELLIPLKMTDRRYQQ